MSLLKAVGTALVLLVGLPLYTLVFSWVRLRLYNVGQARRIKAIGLTLVLADPWYWLFALTLASGVIWFMMKSA
jgi:hypothetical protein